MVVAAALGFSTLLEHKFSTCEFALITLDSAILTFFKTTRCARTRKAVDKGCMKQVGYLGFDQTKCFGC